MLLVAGLAALTVVWRFEPRGQFFYPRCWLYQTTGIKCPGCGATRALHALLNGDLQTAWRQNPLFVALLPLAVWLGLRAVRGGWTGRWWSNPLANRFVIAALVGVTAGFGIARNLRGWPW
jgi:Protein of unknown function (DUF2752)